MKCLTSIKEYAFVASPYPVIITLEDHLTSDLQAKVAKVIAFYLCDYYLGAVDFPVPSSEFHLDGP
jgi:hypothetical protein